MLDLTRLAFNHVNCNIMQERRKYYARNPAEPLFVTIEKDVVWDTMVNPEMISSSEIVFMTTTKLNVGRMSK